MKKLLLAIFSVLLLCSNVYAVGTATVSSIERIDVARENQRLVLTISWTDDTNGTTLAINPDTYRLKGWYLIQAETDPGSTAPTTLYDITLLTASALDLALGTLMNRSATATERVSVAAGQAAYPVMLESFTFTLSGNSVNNATGTLKLIFTQN